MVAAISNVSVVDGCRLLAVGQVEREEEKFEVERENGLCGYKWALVCLWDGSVDKRFRAELVPVLSYQELGLGLATVPHMTTASMFLLVHAVVSTLI